MEKIEKFGGWIFGVAFIALIAIAVNASVEKKAENRAAFESGKTLLCGDFQVSKDEGFKIEGGMFVAYGDETSLSGGHIVRAYAQQDMCSIK